MVAVCNTFRGVNVTNETPEVMQRHSVAMITTQKQAMCVLSCFAAMEQQLVELLLLHSRERGENSGQHQVHQKVQHNRQICDEEDGRPPVDRVARHHHVRITERDRSINSSVDGMQNGFQNYLAVVSKTKREMKACCKELKYGSSTFEPNR